MSINPTIHSIKKADAGLQAAYLTLLASGELARRADIARQHLQDCDSAHAIAASTACALLKAQSAGPVNVPSFTATDRVTVKRTCGVVGTVRERFFSAAAICPDMKYSDSVIAHRYSHVRNYSQVNQAAVKEMYRQVGDLQLDDNGLAYRGLLVRHLALPNGLAGTEKVLEFIARRLGLNRLAV